MRHISVLLMITAMIDSFGQELNGKIIYTQDHRGFNMVEIKAQDLTQPYKQVCTKSDSLGNFHMTFRQGGQYRLTISGPFEPDTVFNVSIGQDEILALRISYPPKICPYEQTRLTGECPDGKHTDHVVPIVYGMVVDDSEYRKKVERNEIVLGGCVVTDCDPHWFCKIHGRRF